MATLEQATKDIRVKRGLDEAEPEAPAVEEPVAEEPAADEGDGDAEEAG